MPRRDASVAYSNDLGLEDLPRLLACPDCSGSLATSDGGSLRCAGCGRAYPRLASGWDLTPSAERWSSETWRIWEALQANGAVGYREDPERNIAVGEREDASAFAKFCGLHGLVLDIGCGPQPWPAYFSDYAEGTRFVGVDPLVGDTAAGYPQLRALAEYLPFQGRTFDQVLFATTLDHFVHPEAALAEACRVLGEDGTIAAWVGHKDPDAPPPERSPEWYRGLERPEGAEDLFHVKRLDPVESEALFEAAGLCVLEREDIPVDPYRSNHFFKLAPGR
jgi:SAM-dependent methyltransferase